MTFWTTLKRKNTDNKRTNKQGQPKIYFLPNQNKDDDKCKNNPYKIQHAAPEIGV